MPLLNVDRAMQDAGGLGNDLTGCCAVGTEQGVRTNDWAECGDDVGRVQLVQPGIGEAVVREYIKKQEQEDERLDQLGLWR